MANKFKKKEEPKPAVVAPPAQIQYVPYETYISKVVGVIAQRLETIERNIDVIKERLKFEEKEKKGGND